MEWIGDAHVLIKCSTTATEIYSKPVNQTTKFDRLDDDFKMQIMVAKSNSFFAFWNTGTELEIQIEVG